MDVLALQSLPAEILQIITSASDTADFLTMRLICNEIADKMHNHFGVTFFQHCRHIVSMESLQALIDISAHKTLGPFVRIVELGTHHMNSAIIHNRDRDKEQTEDLQGSSDPVYCHEAEQGMLIQNCTDRDGYLHQVFKNLRTYGRPLTIGAFDDEVKTGSSQRGWGSVRFYDVETTIMGNNNKHMRGNCCSQAPAGTIEMLLKAATLARCKVAELRFQHNTLLSRKYFRARDIPSGILAGICTATISVPRTVKGSVMPTYLPPLSIDYHAYLLEGLQNVQVLHLQLYPSDISKQEWLQLGDDHPWISKALSTKKLKELRLTNIEASVTNFIAYLTPQKDTLRRLAITGCSLKGKHNWESLEQWIKTNLTLDELLLENDS